MKYAVIVFPGSNCDHDAYYSTGNLSGAESVYLWHKENSIPNDVDCVVIPGGFSYGDYLRCGAIARFSPIMNDVIRYANNGGHVIGICNGFQILTEAGLLPGTLLRNKSLSFICRDVNLKVVNSNTTFTNLLKENDNIRIPIAHGEGNYFADENTIQELEENNQVVFKYSNEFGVVSEADNPNGSINNIAGIVNRNGNVLGMMPHPERYCDSILGGNDGLSVFKSINKFFEFSKEL